MAKSPETDPETPRKKRKGPSIAVWLLMAMLIAGLGGFGVASFGTGVASIGAVGSRKIDVNDYARALQQQLNAFSQQVGQDIPLSQAMAIGLDKQVLQSLLTRTALDVETARIGISVGDAVVASEVTANASFQGVAGGFDRDAYSQSLRQINMTEARFETSLREDTARSILQGAVVGGIAAPAALTETIYAWAAEKRGFSLLRLTEADLPTPLAEPTEAELAAYHTAQIARFTRPEAKRISYVALLPDTLAAAVPVDEVAVRALYDQRIADYVIPEKRLVERLVYGTPEGAAAARARLDAGESFESLVAERGLALEDIDLGDVSQKDLGAAGDAIFALTGPGVVGPFLSDLGPALFRMNAILAAQETSFDQAHAALATEMRSDAARLAIADKLESVDDLLAGGGTLEDLVREQGMTLAVTDYVPGGSNDDVIAGYPAFRAAADAVATGDFPEAILLDDGGLVVLRLDATLPPAPIPFAEVRDAVAAAWRIEALAAGLSAHAISVKTAVEAGAALGAFGIVEVTADSPREAGIEGAPDAVMAAIFAMAPGDLRVIEDAGFAALVQLDAVAPAAAGGDDAAALRDAIALGAQKAIAQDIFQLYTGALLSGSGITLDQAAISAVHAQFN